MTDINWSKPVQNKCNPPVRFRVLCTDRNSCHYPVIAVSIEKDGIEGPCETFSIDGRFNINAAFISKYDLVNTPGLIQHVEYWIVVSDIEGYFLCEDSEQAERITARWRKDGSKCNIIHIDQDVELI